MNNSPTALLRHLRSLQPDRNLEDHEARGIAERQALRLLQILGQAEPAVNVAAIGDLPRIEIRVEPSGMTAYWYGIIRYASSCCSAVVRVAR